MDGDLPSAPPGLWWDDLSWGLPPRQAEQLADVEGHDPLPHLNVLELETVKLARAGKRQDPHVIQETPLFVPVLMLEEPGDPGPRARDTAVLIELLQLLHPLQEEVTRGRQLPLRKSLVALGEPVDVLHDLQDVPKGLELPRSFGSATLADVFLFEALEPDQSQALIVFEERSGVQDHIILQAAGTGHALMLRGRAFATVLDVGDVAVADVGAGDGGDIIETLGGDLDLVPAFGELLGQLVCVDVLGKSASAHPEPLAGLGVLVLAEEPVGRARATAR